MTAQDLYNQGFSKAQEGLDKEAVADFTAAIELKPDFAEAYLDRGYTQIVLGNDPAGISDLRTAAKLYRDRGEQKAADLILEQVKSFEREIQEEKQPN
jgi:tetratricopeptide (TPR) repeat protein